MGVIGSNQPKEFEINVIEYADAIVKLTIYGGIFKGRFLDYIKIRIILE